MRPASLLATWFGCGRIKPAPGTWGTLGALPPALLVAWLAGWWGLLLGAVLCFFAGVWAGQRHARALGSADPGEVVIDEVAGVWLTLVPLCLDWRLWVLAFVVFRAADILKPWPASWCDRHLAGGLGIMTDDLVAGLYAAVVTALLGWWIWDLTCFPWN